MPVSFDLAPTDRLTGLHMVGKVVRRFLISYPVPPEALQKFLPPRAELSIHDGAAWVSACFVRMDDMRPNFFPGFLGMGFNYLIHRTRARLPFPDGSTREAVLVLQPNINRPLLSSCGSMLTGVGFRTRQIEFTEDESHWRVQMTDRGELRFDAEISKEACSSQVSESSRFPNAATADSFLLGVSFGGQWVKGQSKLKLLPETHEPWETVATTCKTRCNSFLEELGVESVEADHVITMTDCPHYFGITPIKTQL